MKDRILTGIENLALKGKKDVFVKFTNVRFSIDVKQVEKQIEKEVCSKPK